MGFNETPTNQPSVEDLIENLQRICDEQFRPHLDNIAAAARDIKDRFIAENTDRRNQALRTAKSLDSRAKPRKELKPAVEADKRSFSLQLKWEQFKCLTGEKGDKDRKQLYKSVRKHRGKTYDMDLLIGLCPDFQRPLVRETEEELIPLRQQALILCTEHKRLKVVLRELRRLQADASGPDASHAVARGRREPAPLIWTEISGK